jgi:hypothetical protein
MSSSIQLLKVCCTSGPRRQQGDPAISLGLASPRILRAGEHVDFFAVGFTPTGREVFGKFNSERDYIRTRVCQRGTEVSDVLKRMIRTEY